MTMPGESTASPAVQAAVAALEAAQEALEEAIADDLEALLGERWVVSVIELPEVLVRPGNTQEDMLRLNLDLDADDGWFLYGGRPVSLRKALLDELRGRKEKEYVAAFERLQAAP
jgi:hypothetical protein